VTIGDDGDDHDARIGLISHCLVMMLWLIASSLTGLHTIEGTAVAQSVVAVRVSWRASFGVGVL